jgi:hypothetical protein
VAFKEVPHMFECSLNGPALVNVPLATIHNWGVAQVQRNNAVSKNVNDLSALVPTSLDICSIILTARPQKQ